jgi:hypothetical protein
VCGIDRCIFQWRTVGINAADQEQDKYILKGLEEAAFHKHQVRFNPRLAHPYISDRTSFTTVFLSAVGYRLCPTTKDGWEVG